MTEGLDARWITDALGYLAGALTTLAFVPQMWLTLRTRDVSGISLAMYSLFTIGVALWLLYGIALGAWPVIVPNVVTLALALGILALKLRGPSLRRSRRKG
jgi:MtN3 and saliva related transmembrane protein